jgi:GNAT superfamily N-acetyltransferase
MGSGAGIGPAGSNSGLHGAEGNREMLDFNAIVLLRRDAGNPCEIALEPHQHFTELRLGDEGRLSQVYRQQGRTGDPMRLRQRFERGFRCFAVEEDDQLIAWFWALHGVPRYFDEMGWLFPLDKTQVWLRDAYVLPERRGRRLLSAMMAIGTTVESAPLEYLSDVSYSNRPSLRAHRAMGFEPFTTVYGLMLGYRLLWRSRPPAQLPTPTALHPHKRVVWLSAEERAWHRAQIA